ncbi:MAG TPA: M23 family metallopeptidase, partial [Bryobacteraceae bacterium]|nr:M23 family metallopeptidase [Bryobacteraceae bacterium]
MKKYVVLGLPIFLLLAFVIALLVASSTPDMKLAQPVTAVGRETPVKVHVENKHGVRELTAYLEQNGQRYPMFEKTEPAVRWSLFRKPGAAQTFDFVVGAKKAAGLKDGKARLVVKAVSNDLRASAAVQSSDVEVITRPLTLRADGLQHYINQGGSELVTFQVDGYWTEAGVRVGNYTFRSFPLPGSKSERFAIFAFPWDVPAETVPVVYARNPTGAEVTSKFWYKLFPKSPRRRELSLDDGFLSKVVSEIDAGGSGDPLSRFLKINGQMRRENNQKLSDLRNVSAEKVLWEGPFRQLSNSKVESQFADERSYVYKGKKVDQQMHLGFDLSVTKNVPIVASNAGKVVWAAPLGIYGNCVVVDHGYGLQSIYGHLSSIDVKDGDAVTKGQVIGKSGATGLAGGDHLHYSMQVDGVQVNPVEWW